MVYTLGTRFYVLFSLKYIGIQWQILKEYGCVFDWTLAVIIKFVDRELKIPMKIDSNYMGTFTFGGLSILRKEKALTVTP